MHCGKEQLARSHRHEHNLLRDRFAGLTLSVGYVCASVRDDQPELTSAVYWPFFRPSITQSSCDTATSHIISTWSLCSASFSAGLSQLKVVSKVMFSDMARPSYTPAWGEVWSNRTEVSS